MKELDFLENINDIDPTLLEDRPVVRSRPQTRIVRRILIAAAAVLLLAGTAFAISKGIRRDVTLTRVESSEESGFEAKVELPLVPWSNFEGEIRSVGEAIAQQYETYVPDPVFSSVLTDPGVWERSFDSLGEAAAFLGLPGLQTPTFPFDEYECSMNVRGDEAGRVDEIRITAQHIVKNDIGAQEYVTILTDAAEESEYVSGGYWTYEFPRDVEFQQYTTPGGNSCAIAVLKPQYDSEFIGLDGYAAAGSALYELNLGAVPREKYDQALQILHDWADALDQPADG